MNKVIYTTSSCDDLHYEQLKVFLLTLELNGGGPWPIIIDLIDGAPALDAPLKKINPNIIEINHLKSSTVYVPPKDREGISNYKLSVMWSRPRGVMRLLNIGHKNILSMDTDIIIRDDISGIWDDLEPGTVKWFYRPKKGFVGSKVQGGVIVFGNSVEIRKYYINVLYRCGQEKGPFVLQESLYYTYLEMQPRLINLGRKYNDDGVFKKSSKIWHCKHGHAEDKVWKKEYGKYLKMVV